MLLLLLRGLSSAAPSVSSYEDEGDCFTLVSRFLKAQDEPYIVDSRLREFSCSWNFQGDTRTDFEKWCAFSGLRCGGKPYIVGFDSVWYRGERMPSPRAAWLRRQDEKSDSAAAYSAALSAAALRRADSLQNLPPLPLKTVFVEYLEIGKNTAEKLGFSYSDYIGRGVFFGYESLFSVTAQALSIGDSSFTYRSYSSVYDSTLSVFWGGSRERLASSNVTSSGIVSNSYDRDNFGLTFRLNGLKYSYEHSTDYEHKISGAGLLVLGENSIFGSYQFYSSVVRGVPFLSSLPGVGFLFSYSSEVAETRYIFIRVVVALLEGA